LKLCFVRLELFEASAVADLVASGTSSQNFGKKFPSEAEFTPPILRPDHVISKE
jgi:hypothetical protein